MLAKLRDIIQRAGETQWGKKWGHSREDAYDEKRARVRDDWNRQKGEHLLPPLSLCALQCLPETEANVLTFCLRSPAADTESSVTAEPPAIMPAVYLFANASVFSPFTFFPLLLKSTFLKQIQPQSAIWPIWGAKCYYCIFWISK